MASKKASSSEVLKFKSPAEFFAENQNIAGFDNAGKALYTTIRELVENSLDAAESAGRLPDVDLTIEEMDTPAFNALRGIDTRKRKDQSLYHSTIEADDEDGEGDAAAPAEAAAAAPPKKGSGKAGGAGGPAPPKAHAKGDDQMYYRLTCRDNGCGMPPEKIPDMLGRVLAGSKYGVRQTRGKFGLGAKMALIWSKKSTGMPIEVTSAHLSSGGSRQQQDSSSSASAAAPSAAGGGRVPAKVSYHKLDIDIYKNEPHVLAHTLRDNEEGWVGTSMSVCISGAWSSYRARVIRYLQQLAVITPYAQFTLHFSVAGGGSSAKARAGDFSYVWKRRSTQMPPLPTEIKHHPSSVNDLLVRSLMDGAKARPSTASLQGFLTSQFSCIDKTLAGRLITELGPDFSPAMEVDPFTTKQVHQLTRLLAVAKIPPPSGACLSPAGEYNLRLGIMKELRPDLVATHSAPVSVYEGNPFIVEAGVALGGKGDVGLTVHRFANRIPLLFEGGADVSTRTAATRIPWATYKIDLAKDKVGVFVSIVSTKIPFKGTGKEYIGDDIEPLRDAVRSAIQSCCSQLRVKLLLASAIRARANRRKILAKYVPDVTRAMLAALKSFASRAPLEAAAAGAGANKNKRPREAAEGDDAEAPVAVARMHASHPVMRAFASGDVTEPALAAKLMEAVEKADLDAALEQASAMPSGGLVAGGRDGGEEGGGIAATAFVAPTPLATFAGVRPLSHAACNLLFLPHAVLRPSDAAAKALQTARPRLVAAEAAAAAAPDVEEL